MKPCEGRTEGQTDRQTDGRERRAFATVTDSVKQTGAQQWRSAATAVEAASPCSLLTKKRLFKSQRQRKKEAKSPSSGKSPSRSLSLKVSFFLEKANNSLTGYSVSLHNSVASSAAQPHGTSFAFSSALAFPFSLLEDFPFSPDSVTLSTPPPHPPSSLPLSSLLFLPSVSLPPTFNASSLSG